MQKETKNTLHKLVETHLISIISNSNSIARHTKRSKRTIHSTDVRTALQLQGTPLVLHTNAGYTDNSPLDLNEFLNYSGTTTSNISTSTSRNITRSRRNKRRRRNGDMNSGGGGGGGEDEEEDEDQDDMEDDEEDEEEDDNDMNMNIIQQPQTPPSEMGMVMHWLAVEGKQPAIPLNPTIHNHIQTNLNSYNNIGIDTNHTYGSGGGGHLIEDQPPDEEYSRKRPHTHHHPSNHPSNNATTTTTTTNNNNNDDNISIQNLLPRLLSQELQLYYTRITLALQQSSNPQNQDTALLRLKYDSGIQELIPFFLHYITPKNNTDLCNVSKQIIHIRTIHNLVRNVNIHLELQLEKIIPLVLNCIVPRVLSSNAYDHWYLRDEASRTLLSLCVMFGEKYAHFQPSVIGVLTRALDGGRTVGSKRGNTSGGGGKSGTNVDGSGKTTTTSTTTTTTISTTTTDPKPNPNPKPINVGGRYGALVALSDLGPKVVDAVVLPYVGQFWIECEEELKRCAAADNDNDNDDNDNDNNDGVRFGLYRLQDALLYTMSVFLSSGAAVHRCETLDNDKMSDIFGDQLVPFSGIVAGSEYFDCFI